MTTALAWLGVTAACVGAVLFGQTARTAPARGARPAPRTSRIGLVVSLSGPWLAVLLALTGGVLTGQWLVAALVGVVVAAAAGLVLAPD